ncbi:hypothetical protein TURU_107582 [Turdus rufiventris]|nr:hypothetical protein TURU_107582 [Turdus rufiventris]
MNKHLSWNKKYHLEHVIPTLAEIEDRKWCPKLHTGLEERPPQCKAEWTIPSLALLVAQSVPTTKDSLCQLETEFLSDQYWVQSVKPLDDGAECSLSKFAGDTKLGGVAVTVDGNAAIQNDLKWVNRNVMRFNKENCKVLHLGRSIPMHQCVMVASSVERSLAEKDLKDLVNSRFNMRLSVSKKISYRFPLDIYYISHNFISSSEFVVNSFYKFSEEKTFSQ